jgi:diaminohydroxyphosphoribosylaminopyrimidine deaminase / 5-amino-6-(5-phosphoribosylamino)uracil reductase
MSEQRKNWALSTTQGSTDGFLQPADHIGFDLALAGAEDSVGATAPNPPVGCTILDKSGQPLATAAHRGAGQPHAEVSAIETCRRAGTFGLIHTFLVTLEPCNHHGRTGPCTEAIVATPAERVIFGIKDPNPHVQGGGDRFLRGAGLACEDLQQVAYANWKDLAVRSAALIRPFGKAVRTGLPWVVVKQVIDRRGSMIPPAGCTTFSSASSLDLAHRLRRKSDAILTGSGTIVADAPLLTVRRVRDHPHRRRQLLIMDRRGRTPFSYIAASAARGLDAVLCTDLFAAIQAAGRAGALQLLVEAGPRITQAVLELNLWDEWVLISQGATPADADRIVVIYRDGRNVHDELLHH